MKTIFVQLTEKRHFHIHEQLNADQWFTLSVPLSRSEEVWEVPDTPGVASFIQQKYLKEVSKPAKYNKLGNKPEDFCYIESDKDTKYRMATEKARLRAERQAESKRPEKAEVKT